MCIIFDVCIDGSLLYITYFYNKKTMISIWAFILSIIAILAIINIAYYIHTMQVRNPYLTDEQVRTINQLNRQRTPLFRRLMLALVFLLSRLG